jgi:hypothetical protein
LLLAVKNPVLEAEIPLLKSMDNYTWDGRDRTGLRVSGGTYFVKLAAGDVTRTRKVVFLGGR